MPRLCIISLLALLLPLVACGSKKPEGEATASDVVATVNGEAIARKAFDARVARELAAAGGATEGRSEAAVREHVLGQLVDHVLLAQHARSEGLYPDDSDIDGAIATERNGYANGLAFDRAVRANHGSPAAHRDAVIARLVRARLIDKAGASTYAPTEAEVQAYYDAEGATLERPALARVDLARLPASTTPQEAGALASALREALAGDAEPSEIGLPASAKVDRLGWMQREQLDPAVAAVVFAEPAAKVTEPLELDGGLVIAMVRERRAAEMPALEDLRDSIVDTLKRRRAHTVISELLETLRASADIKYSS